MQAFQAQAAFVSQYTAELAANGYTDDDTDYLPGSLRLLEALQDDHYHAAALRTGLVMGQSMALMRDTENNASADAADRSRKVIHEYGCYPGDFGPPEVFEFLGLPEGAEGQ